MAQGSSIKAYDAVEDALKVSSLQKKFRDSFSGSSLNASNWDSSVGTGGSITVTGGTVVLASGTTASSVTSITSKETFTFPFRVHAQLTLSQRIANQTFYIEAISVDSSGTPNNLHKLAWAFDLTTATNGKYVVQAEGVSELVSAASTITTTAGTGVYELETFPDEVWFHTSTLDSSSGRTNSYRRHQQIPNPNARYKIRLRWVNGGTPPATTTNATLQYVSCIEYALVTTELTTTRGNTSAGAGLATHITNSPTVGLTSDDTHDGVAGTSAVMIGGYASTAAPAAVSADADMARIWVTRSGAVNIADGGSTISIDDGAASITVDGTVDINNISGTVSLPTGAATATKQDTIIGHVDGIETLLGTIDADTSGILTAVELLDDVVATDGAAALTKAYQIAGTDGTNAQIISTNVSGHVNIADGGGTITVDDGGTTLSIDDGGGTITVDGTVAATQSGTWDITNISGTISLPTGAATSAKQDTMITALQLLDDVVATDGSTALTKAYQVAGTDGTNAQIISTNVSGHINIADGGNSITVDGTVAATQSGTWNITNISGTVSLPTGAATDAKQDTIIGHVDGIETLLGTIDADTGSILTAVQLLDDVVATDGAAALTKAYQVAGTDGTNAQIISTNATGHVNIADGGNSITVDGTVAATQSGTWNITNITGTVSLPTGATTSAKQDTMITSLQLLDDVVATDGAAALTKGYQIAGTDGTNAQIISTNTTGHVNIADGGNSITVDGTVAATQSGTWNITNISGTVSLPTGAATDTKQDTIITALQLLDDVVATDGSAALTKAYQVAGTDGTNAQIISTNVSGHVNIADGGSTISIDDGAGSITVDGTVAATQSGTWNITNISGTVSLPTGAATEAKQDTMITALQLLDDVVATDGSAALTKAYQVAGTDGTNAQIISTNTTGHVNIADGGNSITVDGTVAATQSGTWNITNISGTVSLPTGAATSARQDTMITALQLLDDVVATDGSAALTKAYQVAGTDGTNAQIISTNVTGHVNIADGGNSITVDGTVSTAADDVHDDAAGTTAIMTGGYASTATPAAVSADGDTARLWVTRNGALNIADGGSSISIDDGGNIITVDGTVAATQSGSWNIADITGTVSLPTGASTAAKQDTIIGHIDGLETLLGTIDVDTGNIVTAVQLLDDVVATDGAAALTKGYQIAGTDGTNAQIISTNTTGHVNIADGGNSITVDGTIAATQSGTWNIGTVTTVTTVSTVTSLSQLAGAAINLGAGTTGSGTLRVIEATGATGTQTNPSLSNVSATLLAANTARRSATVYNGSTATVYVRLSATAASTTTYTVKLYADDYYEVPSQYNGAITAILDTGSTTSVQVTEIT